MAQGGNSLSWRRWALVGVSVANMGVPVQASKKEYQLDTAHSSVTFKVPYLAIGEVTGTFAKWEGEFTYDAQKDEIGELLVKFDLDSIRTNNDDRDAHLRSEDFFGVRDKKFNLVEKFRYMTYEGKKFIFSNKRLNQVTGALSMKGSTRMVTLNVEPKTLSTPSDEMLFFKATTEVNRRDFGLTWDKPQNSVFEKAAGKTVGDEIKIEIIGVASLKKDAK